MGESIIYLKETGILTPEATPEPDSIQSLTARAVNKAPGGTSRNPEEKSAGLNNRSILKSPISQELRYSDNIRGDGASPTGSNVGSNITKY